MLRRRHLIAAAGATAMLPRARAATPDKASLRMDWALSGYQVPFYWAKAQGHYEAAGIDLDIHDGAGSSKAAQLVAAQQDTFGLCDALVAVNSIDKGMRIKSVYTVVQDGGSAIISWAKAPFRTPKDMIGHSVAGAAEQKSWLDLFLTVNHVPTDAVKVRIVSVAARNQVFYQHEVDGIISTVIGSPMDMIVAAKEGRGEPIYIMPFSDFGVKSMTTGVIVHGDTIAQKPDLVRRFVAASAKGLSEILDPAKADTATDAAMRISGAPAIRRESVKLQWLATLPRLQLPETKGKPLGWTTDAEWEQCVNLLLQTKQIDAPIAVSKLYTNAFVPA
jgi:NitT/TauT family transport system substrate-binding protein